MTDREFSELFMKSLYSKHTGKFIFSIYPITKQEIETLEPIVGFPDFEFTDRQKKVYGALQRKYGLHFWHKRERPLKLKQEILQDEYQIQIDDLIDDARHKISVLEYDYKVRWESKLF